MASADEIASELDSFYKGYIDSFNREDIDMYTQTFAFPYAVVTGAKGLGICKDESDHQRFYSNISINLKERGWARSVVDQFKAWPYSENLAMIMADVTRYRADNSVIEKVRATYTLRRDGKNWKIVTLSEVAPPFLGPGAVPRP
ncbi:MAG: hypothetical protein ABSG46_18070 [Candidatus Binataceae bacterium]